METIAERLKSVQETLKQSTLDAHRLPNSVKLLAVSKTKPVSDIMQAYAAGQRLFGENYVQEGVEKIQALQHLSDIEWHFIGPLQSNKTRLVAENFHWVHGLDRIKIAKRLAAQCPADKILNICIQLNIDDDQNKAGITADQLDDFIQQLDGLSNLKLRGLMTILKAKQAPKQQSASFVRMREIFDRLKQQNAELDTLSMGMSGDMHNAIASGSTMVRIGTAIFGSRD